MSNDKQHPESVGVMRLSGIYRFEGFTFELHRYCGPILCRKDGIPAARQPGPRSHFWTVIGRWQKLSKAEREKTRICG